MAAAPAKEPVPRRIGPYEIVGRVAHGGMAEVFAARTIDPSGAPAVVAIKRPRRDIIDEKHLIAMFLDEARLASHVRSPHVVETLAVGTDDGQPYLVMPMVVGVSLHRLIARGPMPPNVAAEIGAQAALGLDAAHRATDARGAPLGIVHRDVSPQNVMVDVDGRARVADFGVATAYSRITRTRTGQIKGKLGYLSPEQIHGEKVDPRSDVFALGIVVWEMLAGRRLVRAKTYLDAHHALVVAPFPSLAEIAPQVPTLLDAVVVRALERDRNARWPDAASFARALREATEPARPTEISTLVRARAEQDVSRLGALAAAATGTGAWSLDVTALAGGDAGDDSATQISGSGFEATIVSEPMQFEEPPAPPRSWWARLRGWLFGR